MNKIMKTLTILCLLAISINCLSQHNTVNNYSQYNPFKTEKVNKKTVMIISSIVCGSLIVYGGQKCNKPAFLIGTGVFGINLTFQICGRNSKMINRSAIKCHNFKELH